LHEGQARLWVEGRAHDLDHSCHQVLCCLLAESGRVVSKERLLEVGWPGRVVSENSLTKAIGRLRQALEDPDGNLLCTVHGYGYRLAASAERRTEPQPARADESAPAPEPPTAATPSPARAAWAKATLALLLATLIGALAWRAWSPPYTPAARPAVVVEPASIAVLPFVDLSANGDQRYFGDGLADELLDRLAKIRQLRVAGRTSSFSFRDKNVDVAQIGSQLGVRHVLEGSVRRSDERLRITVQLIDARSGFHVWSETYDRALTDLFAVQDEIASEVARALELELLPAQTERLRRHHTDSLEAYELYLRAMSRGGTPDEDRRAVAALERVIQLDPRFVQAHVALAQALGGEAEYADTPEAMAAGKERSLKMMDKAIALDPGRADIYAMRADLLYSTRWDWAAAQRDLDRAAALEPGPNMARMINQARLYAALGRLPEALAMERQIIAFNPDFAEPWTMAGFHLVAAGRHGEARAALARSLQLRPDESHALFHLGTSYLLEGKSQAALKAYEGGGGAFRLTGMALALHDAGRESESAALLETLVRRYAHSGAYQVAQVYAWRGETEQAFAWLERAEAQRDAGLIYLKFDPLMRKLHGDVRYAAWLRRMRLSS
jgi:TolB-like protein/DNA-binding winged helix-turn-helix (wHTH) protein/Tfp pilus assembly protein PilF